MSNVLRPVVHQLSRNVPYMKRIQSLLSLPTSPLSSDDEGSDLEGGSAKDSHSTFSGGASAGSAASEHRSGSVDRGVPKSSGKSKSKPPSRRESNAEYLIPCSF